MTLKQQYQAYLDNLEAEQQAYPIYPDISWYRHTEQPNKVEEIIKYGRPIPTLEDFKRRLESAANDSENLTF